MDFTDSLRRAHQLVQDDRYQEALEALDFAFNETSEDEAVIIEDRRKEVEKRQRDYASRLDNDIQCALKDWDIPQADELLTQIESAMPGYPRLEALQKLIAARGKEVRAQQRVKTLKEDVDSLLDTLEMSNFDLALNKVKKAVEAEPDNPLLHGLFEETFMRRDERYRDVRRITKFGIRENFDQLFKAFDEQIARGVPTLPWFEFIEPGRIQEKVFNESYRPTAREAYDHLVELRANWEEAKGQQKLQDARYMLNSAPEEAKKLVEEAKDFKYLSIKARNEIDTFLEKDVAEAIKQRQQTKINLEQAIRWETQHAWQSIKEIEKRDPHAPEIELARQEIRHGLKRVLKLELEKLDQKRLKGQFIEVGAEAARIRSLIAEDEPLSDFFAEVEALVARCVQDRLVQEQGAAVMVILEGKDAELPVAEEVIHQLEERLGDCLADYPTIEILRRRLNFRLGLGRLINWLGQQADSAQTTNELQELEKECREAAHVYGYPADLVDLARRIQARRAFFEAEAARRADQNETARMQYWQALVLGCEQSRIASLWLRKLE